MTKKDLIELEKYERIVQDTKKNIFYDKHVGKWYWCDGDATEYNRDNGFDTRLDAVLDAIEPYLDEQG